MENNKLINFLCNKKGTIALTVILCILSILGMSISGAAFENFGVNSEIMEGVVTALSLLISVLWIVCGWKALTFITPDIFLIMPLIGWVVYFMIKGFLSLIVGIFVAPYYISKTITKTMRNKYGIEE